MSVSSNTSDIIKNINRLIKELEETRPRETVLQCKEQLTLLRLRIQNDKTLADGSLLGTYSPAYLRSRPTKKDDLINLTDTGAMFRDLVVTLDFVDDSKCSVIIEGSNTRSRDLLGYHSERWENILQASEDEIKKLKKASTKRVTKLIQKFL